jgi:predicted ATPase
MLSSNAITSDLSGGLLERGEALSALADALAAVVSTETGRFALVRGEAGAGKTALVSRFCANQQGARILWGACDALFTPRPLGPFLDIARALGGEVERVSESGAMPYRFAEALMRELQGPRSTVVVVEDVHWADEATLDVLRIVARRIETLSALVVATYRDDELDRMHPLRTLLGELTSGEATARIDVEPLSLDGVATLAAPVGADVDVDDLYRKTSGNPFFVTEALAAAGAEVPDTVRDAVLARAARLGPGAREVLEAVAVVPPHAELWLLEALVPRSTVPLEECLAAGMLRAEPDRVLFRHELARRALEDSLPPDARIAFHRRALAALAERRPVDLARLAHHAETAGDAEAVIRYAPAAAEHAASVGAHREAADHYARVLRFRELLPLTEQAALFERRAHECYLTDQNPEALGALHEALDCYRELGDARAEGLARRRLSEMLWCPGRVAEAREAGLQAVLLLEQFEPGIELGHAWVRKPVVPRKERGEHRRGQRVGFARAGVGGAAR